MSTIDELLRNNEQYAASFSGPRAAVPAKQVAVVGCMDTRLDVYRALGLAEGDAHVITNAGGIITDDEIRSLAISQRVLHTREVMILQHTGCGLLQLDDDEFAATLAEETGQQPEWRAHAFRDLDESVRAQVARVQDNPFVPHSDQVRGFVFDVETGALREVT